MIKNVIGFFADLIFMSLTIWREARGESREGKAGVAYVILNRVKRASWQGNDVLSVVSKRLQFSSLTDPKDKQLTTWPLSTDGSWWDCLYVAFEALYGNLANPVGGADHYFDVSISPPNWAKPSQFVKRIDRLNFYDIDKDTEV